MLYPYELGESAVMWNATESIPCPLWRLATTKTRLLMLHAVMVFCITRRYPSVLPFPPVRLIPFNPLQAIKLLPWSPSKVSQFLA